MSGRCGRYGRCDTTFGTLGVMGTESRKLPGSPTPIFQRWFPLRRGEGDRRRSGQGPGQRISASAKPGWGSTFRREFARGVLKLILRLAPISA